MASISPTARHNIQPTSHHLPLAEAVRNPPFYDTAVQVHLLAMPGDVDWNLDEIHLKDCGLPHLPDSPSCPNLVKLFLQVPSLAVIPPAFFEQMPLLEVLDLSNTNIVSLPASISRLSLLQELVLRDCSALMELPSEIGMLSKLKLFDIKGTELMFLPKEMGKLRDLEVLRVTLSQYAKDYIKTSVSETVIPRKMISEFKKLKELCVIISVGPEPEWWEEEVKYLQNELCDLENLETLVWYLPTTEVLQQFLLLKRNHIPIYANLSNLKLTIGQHARLTSCLPHGLEKKFEEFKNCLKWINAEGSMDDISKIMVCAEALFLSRHWTIEKFSTLNVTKLKYCLLAECNEMEALVDVEGFSEDVVNEINNGEKVGFELLQYMSIHYMNKLQSIWKGPIHKDSLSRLRILSLHTCPQLTSIFTSTVAQNLPCLIELTVEDCPKVTNLISNESHNIKLGPVLQSLEKIFLLDLPLLVNIFNGQIMLENLRTMLIYSCLQLRDLSNMELPRITKIEGEDEWWKALDCDKSLWENIFVELKENKELVEQLFDATNSLQHFHDTLLHEIDEKESSSLTDMREQAITHDTSIERQMFHPREDIDEEESSSLSDMLEQSITLDTLIDRQIFHPPEVEVVMGKPVWGALDALSKVSNAILVVIKKTWYFKSQLKEMKEYLDILKFIFADTEALNKKLDRRKEETDRFLDLLKQAQDLVLKCEHIKLNYWKKYSHTLKLEELNISLDNYVQSYSLLQAERDKEEVLVKVKDSKRGLEKESSSGWLSSVPLPKGDVIGFDDRVIDLKAMMFKDSLVDDCSVVVVSAAGGSGKTTFVKLFCHDPDIKGRFGKNIYFVTISRVYDKKVIIKNLLGQLHGVTNDGSAIQQWESFLGKNKSEVLLVLDDVWHDSIIKDFKFKSPRYKILVTSRNTFKEYKTYKLASLDIQDASRLFRGSASPEQSNIPDDLVEELVKCCKFHPLVLTVIGGMLRGTHLGHWRDLLNHLSCINSFLDLDDFIRECLEKSSYLFDEEPELKECYLDLGLFPEDQKINATALLDVWAHLYKHDDDGLETMYILNKISSRNLVTLSSKRKRPYVAANVCVNESVMQHDVMRDLAIHLNQKSLEHRERLIINAYGQDHPQLQEILNARVLSISTDERFYLEWNFIEVPKVEVFVFNIMSRMHPMPDFVQFMKKLKVLIITNYGYYFSQIPNFPEPQCLSGLTTLRLDHVSISSISATILELRNLQKLSLIMCKLGNSFNQVITNKLSNLLEICIESCDDLFKFPAVLCKLDCLERLSITDCHELLSLSEEFGNLSNLEFLQLASCSNLRRLPESMRNLKVLRVIDISHCLNLHELPLHIVELGSLRIIDVTGCTGLHKLPKSVKDFNKMKVVCDEETSHLWSDFINVEVVVAEEDAFVI